MGNRDGMWKEGKVCRKEENGWEVVRGGGEEPEGRERTERK